MDSHTAVFHIHAPLPLVHESSHYLWHPQGICYTPPSSHLSYDINSHGITELVYKHPLAALECTPW